MKTFTCKTKTVAAPACATAPATSCCTKNSLAFQMDTVRWAVSIFHIIVLAIGLALIRLQPLVLLLPILAGVGFLSSPLRIRSDR